MQAKVLKLNSPLLI